jgi:hypothetical protein
MNRQETKRSNLFANLYLNHQSISAISGSHDPLPKNSDSKGMNVESPLISLIPLIEEFKQ